MRLKALNWVYALTATGLALVSIHNVDRKLIRTKVQSMMANTEEPNSLQTMRMMEETLSPVIVSLIHQDTHINDLCLSMKTLVNAQGSLSAPVLMFYLESPSQDQQNYLQSCTNRTVSFAPVDTSDFPVGFVPEEGRDYSSSYVNRFWTTKIWEHTAIEPFDIIMRIDHDTCLSIPNPYLPKFNGPYHNYSSHHFPGTVELNVIALDGMYQYCNNYRLGKGLLPGHDQLWQVIDYTHQATRSLPNFLGSFEVVRKSFMQKTEVRDWHHALTDEPPYGYFTEGWNVNAERFLTMAIFGSPSSVDSRVVPGYIQKTLVNGLTHDRVCALPFE